MKLRKVVYQPSRFDDEEFGKHRKNQHTVPAYPELLESTIIPYNPDAPPAGFPSLPLPRELASVRDHDVPIVNRFGSTAPNAGTGSDTTSGYRHGVENTILEAGYGMGPAEDDLHFEGLSLGTIDEGTVCADSEDVSESGIVDPDEKVNWGMLDKTIQNRIYNQIFKRLETSEEIASLLKLSLEELSDAEMRRRLRCRYTLSSKDIWNHCRSISKPSQDCIEPEILREHLDYLTLAYNHEITTKAQIQRGKAFLKQRGINLSMLYLTAQLEEDRAAYGGDHFLQSQDEDPLTSPRTTAFMASLPAPDSERRILEVPFATPPKVHHPTVILTINKDGNANVTKYDPRAESPVGISEGRHKLLGCDLGPVHRGHNRAAFVSHFLCLYFPEAERLRLLRKDPQLFTGLEFWLMYGGPNGDGRNLPPVIPTISGSSGGAVCTSSSHLCSVRGLRWLFESLLKWFRNVLPSDPTVVHFFGSCACLWLYTTSNAMQIAQATWDRVIPPEATLSWRKLGMSVAAKTVRQFFMSTFLERSNLSFEQFQLRCTAWCESEIASSPVLGRSTHGIATERRRRVSFADEAFEIRAFGRSSDTRNRPSTPSSQFRGRLRGVLVRRRDPDVTIQDGDPSGHTNPRGVTFSTHKILDPRGCETFYRRQRRTKASPNPEGGFARSSTAPGSTANTAEPLEAGDDLSFRNPFSANDNTAYRRHRFVSHHSGISSSPLRPVTSPLTATPDTTRKSHPPGLQPSPVFRPHPSRWQKLQLQDVPDEVIDPQLGLKSHTASNIFLSQSTAEPIPEHVRRELTPDPNLESATDCSAGQTTPNFKPSTSSFFDFDSASVPVSEPEPTPPNEDITMSEYPDLESLGSVISTEDRNQDCHVPYQSREEEYQQPSPATAATRFVPNFVRGAQEAAAATWAEEDGKARARLEAGPHLSHTLPISAPYAPLLTERRVVSRYNGDDNGSFLHPQTQPRYRSHIPTSSSLSPPVQTTSMYDPILTSQSQFPSHFSSGFSSTPRSLVPSKRKFNTSTRDSMATNTNTAGRGSMYPNLDPELDRHYDQDHDGDFGVDFRLAGEYDDDDNEGEVYDVSTTAAATDLPAAGGSTGRDTENSGAGSVKKLRTAKQILAAKRSADSRRGVKRGPYKKKGR